MYRTGLFVTLLVFLLAKATGGQLTVSVSPTVYQGAHNVALGSVVQLYCTASSSPRTAPIITWVKDSSPLESDPAHIRIRTSTDDSTGESSSVLIVDYFTTQDDGDYLCRASDGGGTMESTMMSLTALDPASAAVTDILEIQEQPSDQEDFWRTTILGFISSESDALGDNRTVVPINQSTFFDLTSYQLLHCIANHNGVGTTQPTVVWVKDGVEVTPDGSKIIETSAAYSPGNGAQSDLTINDFQESDTGVYQCIFTNLDNDMELITSIPFRLDTGTNYVLRHLSPETIIIDPPEKLVIEVEAAGAYSLIEWEKNGQTASFLNPNFPGDVRIFPNFFEIHVMDPTDDLDLGNYDVILAGTLGTFIEFTVLPYISPTTPEVSHQTTVTIQEGGSVDISCTSSGNPLPTFSWKIGGVDVRFSQSDITVDLQTSGGTVSEEFSFTPGSTTSTLYIVDAEYPSDLGDYECIATNSHNGVDSTNSSTITVDIQATANQPNAITVGIAVGSVVAVIAMVVIVVCIVIISLVVIKKRQETLKLQHAQGESLQEMALRGPTIISRNHENLSAYREATMTGGVQRASNIEQSQPLGDAIELSGCVAYGVSRDMGELPHSYDTVGNPLDTMTTAAEEDDYEIIDQHQHHSGRQQSSTLPGQRNPLTAATPTSQSSDEEDDYI